jgi:hypothetical protein
MSNGNSIFTQEEQETLDKIKKIRLEIMDSMTSGGVPDKVGEIRVLNEVLSAVDKMTADSAAIRIKQDVAANNGAIVDTVVELLKQSRANRQKYIESGIAPEISSELQYVTVVDGEADINPEPLVPEEFAAPTFDASSVKGV